MASDLRALDERVDIDKLRDQAQAKRPAELADSWTLGAHEFDRT